MAAPEGYNALGKIGISYKGEYASNTAYERLDAVAHNGSTYLAIKDAPDGAPRDDKLNWIYLAKGFSGDIGDSEIAFTEAENRENINTGESVKTVFGKIKKFFADLTAPAFAQMITSKDDLLATKATGYVPDAKAVADTYTELNGKLIDQSVGNSITLSNIIGIIGYAFDNKLVVAYVPLPFVTKNTNYEIKLNRVDFDSFGNVLSKCNVSVKTNCGFSFTCTPDNATYGMAKMITNLSFTIIFR